MNYILKMIFWTLLLCGNLMRFNSNWPRTQGRHQVLRCVVTSRLSLIDPSDLKQVWAMKHSVSCCMFLDCCLPCCRFRVLSGKLLCFIKVIRQIKFYNIHIFWWSFETAFVCWITCRCLEGLICLEQLWRFYVDWSTCSFSVCDV